MECVFMNKYEASLDWLNVVVYKTDVKDFLFDLNCIDEGAFDLTSFYYYPDKGTYNYKSTLMHRECPLRIAWCPVEGEPFIALDSGTYNPFIFVSFSGDALRYFNDRGHLADILLFLGSFDDDGTALFKSSRCDIALDLFEQSPIISLVQEAVGLAFNVQKGKPNIVCSLNRKLESRKTGKVTYYPDNFKLIPGLDPDFLVDDPQRNYCNVQLGNHGSSSGMFRMYNKLAELKYGRLKGDWADQILAVKGISRTGYWWRMEYELHADKANQVFCLLLSDLKSGDNAAMVAFVAVATSFFRIVDVTQDRLANNDDSPLWTEFLDTIKQSIHFVQLASIPYIPHNSLPKFERNMLNLCGYIYACIEYLSSCPTLQKEFYERARPKYETLDRYRYIREGIAEMKGGEAS